METVRNWALPGLLAAGQLLWLWPGAGLLDNRPPGPVGVVGVLVAVAVETVALGLRRRAPVRALVGALGASVLGQAMAYDDYADLGLSVALYSVAVRCPAAVTSRALVAAVASSLPAAALRFGFHPALVTQLAIQTGICVGCVGLGLARRQWSARRLAADRLLAGTQESQQRAGEDERARLARELHDVGAHHLTSVVVTVDVARRLGERKPELVAEALEFAERTGRETLTAIQRLIAVMRDTGQAEVRPMTGRIQELVSGFGRLGRPIATELPADLAGPAAEATHGIVREALTNALRYAPGAAVRVVVRRADGNGEGDVGGGGMLELTVDNTAPRGGVEHGGMGSGRGITGMRERAVALGGELTAGPDPDGGWRVRARLPDTTGPRHVAVRPRRRDFPREQRLTDLALVFTATVLPLVFLLVAAEDWRDRDATAGALSVGLVSALLTLHALPLLWRRRAPWAVFAAVLATGWLWPVVCGSAPLSGQVSPFLAGGLMTETLAVYALGAYGPGAATTWPAPFVAAGANAGVLVATAAADGELVGEAVSPLPVLAIFVPLGVLLFLVYVLAWSGGLLVRRRRVRAVARDDFALSSFRWQARTAAGAERHRLAARLRDAVLQHTSALVQVARQGRLDEVADEARAALAAMRELLHEINEAQDERHPRALRPTAADLDALCRTAGRAGRKVTVRGIPESAEGLPEPVILTVYRMLEAALGAGDRGPVRIRLRRGRGPRRRRAALQLTITGVRLAVNGPVAERLRVRAAAANARVALEPTGTVRVLLLLPAGPGQAPAPAQEVSPSPHA
ncbi:histidine kinase [Streptomyces sp. NPDC092369]|uniref:sensor histidine kinase n=1 Tax=Streptomyces sp. NPDC092369 TaxID=3366015 RepID=UPI0038157B7E